MKELYKKPALEVEEFENVDVLTASKIVPDTPDTPVGDDED